MKIYYLLILAASILTSFNSCQTDVQNSIASVSAVNDTTLLRKETKEGGYFKKEITYQLIINNDTSDFILHLAISKEDQEERARVRFKKSKTYAQQTEELKLLLKAASTDFDLLSLRSLSIYSFPSLGDMAVEITKEHQKIYGSKLDLNSYTSFFLKSKLTKSVNMILSPYNICVSEYSIEKPSLGYKSQLYYQSKVTIDSSLVPDRILDGWPVLILQPVK